MEGFVNVWVNYFYQYQKKYLILKDFLFSINEQKQTIKEESSQSVLTKEKVFHVKYLNMLEKSGCNLKIEVDRKCTKVTNEILYLRAENEEDILNWVEAINIQKKKYDKFIDDYYVNNTTEKLFSSCEEFTQKEKPKLKPDSFDSFDSFNSFTECLNEITVFIQSLENNLSVININHDLQEILKILNSFIAYINDYSNSIDKYCIKLNPSNSNEFHFLNKSKEIRTLLDELKETVVNSTYGLDANEIISYIICFKENLELKIQDIKLLRDELEYYIENYLRIYLGQHKSENAYNEYPCNNGINSENTNSSHRKSGLSVNLMNEEDKDIVLSQIIMENELMKIKINHLNTQTDIIRQFMNEYDN